MVPVSFCKSSSATILLLAALCLTCATCQNACNGRGQFHNDNSSCTCDSPFPSQGKLGYTGKDCEISVFGGSIDGSDMTNGCLQNNCSTLQPKSWQCFYMDFTKLEVWNYLAIHLNRTSKEGDPDLYGMWYSSKRENVTLPSAVSSSYDFQETSSGLHPWVVKVLGRKDIKVDHVEGMWLCVHSYGKQGVNFTLRGVTSRCPANFDSEGHVMQCSSLVSAPDKERRYTDCSPAGECVCKPPYDRPVEQTYPGLGFESCAATVVPLTDSMFAKNGTVELNDETVPAGSWMFYEFNVTDDDYQVEIDVMEENSARGMVEVYVQYLQPPGEHYHQWEFSRQYTYDWYSYGVDEILFDRTIPEFRTGVWFIGVLGDRHGPVDYTLLLNKYTCPMNCSGRGVCHSGKCECNEGYGGEDCSRERRDLQYGSTVTKDDATFEYDYYTLPALDYEFTNRSIEFNIEVSYKTKDGGYPKWSFSKPEVLVLKGSSESLPSNRNYTFKRVLDKANTTYSITLCASQLSEGVWHLALYNPGHLWSFGYSLTLRKVVRCLNNCNGHGHCTEDGVCQCEGQWQGGDCSVDTQANCIRGSRQVQHRAEDHGTCWFECICNEHHTSCNYYDQVCADFTCDAPQPRANPYRRIPGRDKCVQDECVRDEWVEQDGFACLKKCHCPDDGGACTLGDACDVQSLVCKDGYKRYEDTCYQQPCAVGSLKVLADADLPHADKVFSVCQCNNTVGGPPTCAFSHSQSQLVLYCEEGYSVLGATKDESTDMWIGGQCKAARAGTPAWGVVLVALGCTVVGAIFGVLAVWLYDTKLAKSPMFESQGLYQELSLNRMGI